MYIIILSVVNNLRLALLGIWVRHSIISDKVILVDFIHSHTAIGTTTIFLIFKKMTSKLFSISCTRTGRHVPWKVDLITLKTIGVVTTQYVFMVMICYVEGIPASWYGPQGYCRYRAVDLVTWHLLLLFGPGTPVPNVITQDRFTMNTIDGENILMNMWDWWFLFHFSYKIATNNLANARSHRVNPHAPFNLWPPAFCPSLKLTTVISMPLWSFATKTVQFGDFPLKKWWLVHVKLAKITFSGNIEP